MKILVIDDDAASLAATKSMLEQSPLVDKAEIANNMDDLSASLRADPPDAVLVDVEMGRVSGFEVAAYLQKAYPQIPYIFLTGHAEWALKGYDYSPLDFLCFFKNGQKTTLHFGLPML